MINLVTQGVGNSATSTVLAGSATLATGYSFNDGINGPRSTMVRSNAYTLSGSGYAEVFGVEYRGTSMVGDTCIVSRADVFFPDVSSAGFNVYWYDSSYHLIVNQTPLSSSLVGITSQDYVVTFASQTANRWYVASTQSRPFTSIARQYSKIIVGSKFDFGANPDLRPAPEWEIFEKSERYRFSAPMRATRPYHVEARISLTWGSVTRAKMASFRALPQLLYWPFYLYDDNGDIWPWKLEHVILESFTERLIDESTSDVTLTFARLAHYE